MRKGVTVLAILFSLSLLPAFSATPPKPGSVCSKLGIAKTYKGKKYTCVKNGKKLVWNRGVLVRKASPQATPNPTTTPTPTPSASPTPKASEKDAPPFRLSTKSIDPDLCRLKYPNKWETGFGFPRSQTRLPNRGTINAIFIFVDFPDAIGSDSPRKITETYFNRFNDFYKSVSYGEVEFKYSVPDRYFRINKPQNSYRMNVIKGETNPDVSTYFTDAIKSADPFVDFTPFDVIYVIPSETTTEITYGPAFPMGSGNNLLRTDEKVFYSGAVGGTDSRTRSNSLEWVWLAHETGHLFGLEHPWKVQSTAQGATTLSDAVPIWDLMLNMWIWSPQAHEFLGWTRFLLDWIKDVHVNCQNIKDTSWTELNFRLSPLAIKSAEEKLALIRISDTTALAIESRRNLGFDRIPPEYEGALIYLVDVTKQSNEGMATLINGSDILVQGLSVGTLKPGRIVRFGGLNIEVLHSDKSGDYVRVTRG
jgi:M6 family metalloprotease-like protein